MASSDGFEHSPSPNHGERATGKPIDMLILHYTGMVSEERAIRWLCDPESAVSSHYVVREDGSIVQLVDESRRAWHAGRSYWAGETDVNSRSIGIEIANPGHQFGYRPFPGIQIEGVIRLCRDVLRRHAIPPRHVLAHSDVAPDRKEDPGELFPWQQLAEAGIGLWVPPSVGADGRTLRKGDDNVAVRDLAEGLRAYGYGVSTEGVYDDALQTVVTAFQRHFQPARFDGIADPDTVATLTRLLRQIGRE